MTTPGYYRPRVPGWLWVSLALTVVLAGLLFAARETVSMIQEKERTRVFAEAQASASATFAVQRAAWSQRLDSLRNVLVVRDSLAGVSAYEARGAIAALRRRLAITPITRRETVLVAYADTAIRACSAALSDCDRFRETATPALVTADSLHGADSTAFRGLTFRMTATHDSLRRITRALDRRPSWGTVGTASATSASVGALLCLIFCR